MGKTVTSITSNAVGNTSSITTDFTVEGQQFNVTAVTLDALILQMQSNASLNAANVTVEKLGSNKIRVSKTEGIKH